MILDQPITLPEYGALPAVGILDDLDTERGTKDTLFTVSGYGLTKRVQENSALSNISYRIRLMASSTLINLVSRTPTATTCRPRATAMAAAAPAPATPADRLLRRTRIQHHRRRHLFRHELPVPGTDYAYRLDRQEVLDWINSH